MDYPHYHGVSGLCVFWYNPGSCASNPGQIPVSLKMFDGEGSVSQLCPEMRYGMITFTGVLLR